MKIFIDPGHNYTGADTGATGNGLREQDITFYIADQLRPILERCGFQVKLSRNEVTDCVANSSVNASLSTRCRMANDWGADLFVSVHCNAGGGTGTETYCYQAGISSGYKLAQAVQRRVVEAVGLKDRGVKTNASLAVLRGTNMPAILVETAFIDRETDSNILRSETGQQQYAEAIAKGICDYTGVAYQGGGETVTETKKFRDTAGHWAEAHIQKLADYGVVNGDGGGNFRPDEPITRAEAATMIANALTVVGK